MTGPPGLGSLLEALEARGEAPAVLALDEDGIDTRSCREIAQEARRGATGLRRHGIRPGERVGLLAGASPDSIAACLAVLRAGAVVTPLDTQMGPESLRHVLDDGGVRLILTTVEDDARISKVLPDLDIPRLLIDADDQDGRGWRRVLAAEPEDSPASPDVDEVAALFFTSGTTGRPKGVPLTHANISFQIETLSRSGLVSEGDRVLLPLPLHHVYPFVVGMLTPLAMGLPLVLPHSLTGPQLVRAVREGGVTVIAGVPRLYRALFDGVRGRAASRGRIARLAFDSLLSSSVLLRKRTGLDAGRLLLRPVREAIGPSLRVLASGGAALDPDLAWKLEGMGWRVAIGYGLTETSPLLSINLPGSERLDSVGRPVAGVEIRIHEGEIQARGPGVFSGYLDHPEETREAFTEDGWFRTGDLGRIDELGYLHVQGRASTLIVTEGGENVQPEEIEEGYRDEGTIREIGVLQSKGRLVGVIVPDAEALSGRSQDQIEGAVRASIREKSRRLPSYQRLTDFVIVRDALPRTRLGKIRRHLLIDLYEAAGRPGSRTRDEVTPLDPDRMSDVDQSLLENRAVRRVWDLLRERYPDRPLSPDASPQEDLGIDSLEWLTVTLEIVERTGVELSEETLGSIETVRDLMKAVAEASRGTGTAAPLEDPENQVGERGRWIRPLGPAGSAVSRILFAFNGLLVRALFRVEVRGLEHLPPDRQFVLAPNHLSYLDPFVVAWALRGKRLERTYWAGWVGVAFRNRFARMVSRLARIIPVDYDRGVVSTLALAASVLRRGDNLVWFPEGQRSPDGELQEFKPGLGLLLERFPVRVVPAVIQGTFESMPPGRALPRPGRLSVTFGEALEPSVGGPPEGPFIESLRARIFELGAAPPPIRR